MPAGWRVRHAQQSARTGLSPAWHPPAAEDHLVVGVAATRSRPGIGIGMEQRRLAVPTLGR